MTARRDRDASLQRHAPTGIERYEGRWTAIRTLHHAHPEYQITRTIAGRGRCEYRGGRFALPPGCLALFHPAEPHVIEAPRGSDPWHVRVLHMPPAWLEEGGAPLVQPGPIVIGSAVEAALDRLWSALDGDRAAAVAAVGLLAREVRALPGLEIEQRARSRLVRACLEVLSGAIDRRVTLAELAGRVGATPRAVRSAFTTATGLPPHAWHLQRRVAEAKHRLASGAGVSEAARATGFSDQAHFTRHFSRLVGVSPARYAAGARRDRPSSRL